MREQPRKADLRIAELPQHTQLAGMDFALLNARRRNGTALYCSTDTTMYARYGKQQEVKRELDLHRELERLGFPVAKLLMWEEKNDPAYFIEASLGSHCFSDIFGARASDTGFRDFLLVVASFIRVQSHTAQPQPDWQSVYKGSYIAQLEQELPYRTLDIEQAWQKTKAILDTQPFVITHGDFTTNNILPGGIIDFEDHFYAPAGYDVVSVLAASTWFPKAGDYEMLWPFHFTGRQVTQLVATASEAGGYNLQTIFAAHLFLHGSWQTVRKHAYPKLQAWRYSLFNQLLDEYLAGTLTIEKWMGIAH